MDTHGGWEGGGGGWYEKYASLDSESVQLLNMVKNGILPWKAAMK